MREKKPPAQTGSVNVVVAVSDVDRISGPPRNSAEASVRVCPPVDDEISRGAGRWQEPVSPDLSWADAAGRGASAPLAVTAGG